MRVGTNTRREPATAAPANGASAGGASPEQLGRHAESPYRIPWQGWKRVLARTFTEVSSDRIGLVAAGCAFWATLALFPSISMLISLYGLFFDPVTVEPQLQSLREFLPPAAFQLIAERVHALVSHGAGTLGAGLLISTMFALWSSSTGTKSIISALNMAYEEVERRSIIRFQLVGLSMTLCAVIGAILALAILVAVPAAVGFLDLGDRGGLLIQVASFTILILFVLLSLSLLYRFGPCRRAPRLHWVTPGSLVATLLWVIASLVFSFYVGHVASYDATYGPLGAVAAVMMWFWVSAYVVLLGAELNAELELQTERDSTEGVPKPIGRRGAFVADHVAD